MLHKLRHNLQRKTVRTGSWRGLYHSVDHIKVNVWMNYPTEILLEIMREVTYWSPSPCVLSVRSTSTLSPQDPGFMDPEASVVWRALRRSRKNGHKIKHRALEGPKSLKFRSFMETQVGGQGASLSFPVSQEKKPRLWEVKWLAQGWSCRVVHLGSEHRVSDSWSLIHCVAS